jgi:putative transposase
MPRIARIVGVDLPHHITQRGNYKQQVFFDDTDRNQYLIWLQEYSAKFGLAILAYCLMPNHVHFIAIPKNKEALAKTFNATHMRYAQYYNKKRKVSGHLWQGRFYSCILGQTHLLTAARYIERNPVRANLVRKPWLWEWSSASAHINKERQAPFQLDSLFMLTDTAPKDWMDFIDSAEDEAQLVNLRRHTLVGRPLGTTQFVEKLEKMFGKRLHALPRGRPKTAN